MSTPKSSAEMSHRQLRERNEALAKENAMLSKTLQAYKEKTVNISRLVDKYKTLEALYKDLKAEKDRSCAKVNQARNAVSTARASSQSSNVKDLEADVVKLTSERDAILNALSTCKAQHDGMKAKLDEETARSYLLATERDELAGVATDTRILIKECACEISQLRTEVQALKSNAASRTCADRVASDIVSIKSQVSIIEERVADRASAQAGSEADLASLRAQQQDTASELKRIRAIFSAIASPADFSQFPGPCSPTLPARTRKATPPKPIAPILCNPPSPPAANAPSNVSGPTALQHVRSTSPEVGPASATTTSLPSPQAPKCTTTEAAAHLNQIDNSAITVTAHMGPSVGGVQQMGSMSSRWEGSPPLLLRSPTRSSAVDDTPADGEGMAGLMPMTSALKCAPVSDQRRAGSPGTTAGSRIVPQKRPRPASAGTTTTKEVVRPDSTGAPVAALGRQRCQRDAGGREASAPSPMKRPPPQSKLSSHQAGSASGAPKVLSHSCC